jgi:hypothetical protein
MNTYKTTAVVWAFVVLLIIGAIIIPEHQQKIRVISEVSNVQPSSVSPEYLESTTSPVVDIEKPVSEWEQLSNQEISNIAGKELVNFCYEGMPLSFSESIDMTGDGKPEGLFGCGAGNGDASVLFIKDGNKVSVAKSKSRDGKITDVTFFQKGTVMYSSGFKLLPKENAFYEDGSYFNNNTNRFECDEVSTYVWNPKTRLFEWNAELTKKYTKQYQDNECQWPEDQ